MVPSRENRPSTANTMLLVLKPRPVDFSPNSNLFMGSDSEREAWRKNRVMEMKLRAYMTEVQQQQQSSARLLKTEEYRFLQEAMRRSGVPRSVNMLDQLHFFRDKTFPGRRFSTDWHFRDGHHPHHHKHPPMSARPIRPQRVTALLNRPKTSATLYRKNIEEEDEMNDKNTGTHVNQNNLKTNYEILIDSSGRHVASVTTEQKMDLLTNTNQVKREQEFRQNTELPPIKLKDNKENLQPLDSFKDNSVNLPRDIHASTSNKFEIDREIRTVPEGVERNRLDNLQSQCVRPLENTPPRQRKVSSNNVENKNIQLSRMNSLIDPVSLNDAEKDVNNNNIIPGQNNPFSSSLTDEEIEKEIKNIRVNDFIEKHTVELQRQQQNQEQLDNEIPQQGVSAQLIENKLMESTIEWQDQTILPDQPAKEDTTVVKPQKRLIRQNTKTNFNRIKNEPAPLRHNITSVLRQERTKYEASQKKVKDYLHTMGSKDSSSRNSNANSREPSAHGRRSALRKGTPNA